MAGKTDQAQAVPTKEELKADAQALAAKIKSVPKYDENVNLLYALREANNVAHWLK